MDRLRLFVDLVLHNRYKIIRQLGRGGMGAVYEATDLEENRQVAIKQMLPIDPDLRIAFKREADILRKLVHPGVPRSTDYFENETGLFMVMDFVQGPNLGQLLSSRGIPFTPHQVKRWAEDLLQILIFLHGQHPRIIHRDIKPANLKLTPQGRIILLDFGLAKELNDSNDLTIDICMLAYTPHYAPLEQIQGESAEHYSDLYALGATLYNLLTSIPPADALKRANHLLCKKRDALLPINHLIQGVPNSLASLVTKALSLQPSDRPTSATEMLRQLRAGIIAPSFKTARTPLVSPRALPTRLEAPNTNSSTDTTVVPVRPTPGSSSPTLHRHSRRNLLQSGHRNHSGSQQNQICISFPDRSIQQSPVRHTATAKLHFQQLQPKPPLHPTSLECPPLPAAHHYYQRTARALSLLISIALILGPLYYTSRRSLDALMDYTRPDASIEKTQTQQTAKPLNSQSGRSTQKPALFLRPSAQPTNPITLDDFYRQRIHKKPQRAPKRHKNRRRPTQPNAGLPTAI